MNSKSVKIYHNPKCSKSRETLALLRAKGVEPQIVEYLKQPLDRSSLSQLVEQLQVAARAILRQKEESFKHLNIDLNSDDEVLNAIAENPQLMERPIVVVGDRAAIGRPPENVLALL